MRLSDAIDLFTRRTFGLLDDVCEVWVSVDRGKAHYTILVPDEMDNYNKCLIAQRLRRAITESNVVLRTCQKSMFRKHYTMYKVYPTGG